MKGIQQAFGARVKELREAKGISQEALADICGLHRTYIGLIERGARNLSLGTVEIVAQGLEVPVADLFSGVPVSESPKRGQASSPRQSIPKEVAAHLETIRQILSDAGLTDSKRYEALLRAVRKRRNSVSQS